MVTYFSLSLFHGTQMGPFSKWLEVDWFAQSAEKPKIMEGKERKCQKKSLF
jgi:hypothetical protein